MSFRRILLLSTFLLTLVMATGCLNNGQLSAIQFNNRFVETINTTSAALETSTKTYDEAIPNIVTEDSAVDVAEMESALAEARKNLEAAEVLSTLRSNNEEQQTAVEAQFKTFLELANTYLETYGQMITYYKEQQYKENLDKVGTFDKDLQKQYNQFIASHNKLVDVLAGFVK